MSSCRRRGVAVVLLPVVKSFSYWTAEYWLDLESGGRREEAVRAPDEAALVAGGAGEDAVLVAVLLAAPVAVLLPAPVAAAAGHVALVAAAAAGGMGRGGGWRGRDDAVQLAGLVEALDLLDAPEVAAVHEDLREGQAQAGRQERGELRDEGVVHGQVALVDGGADPPQDEAHGVAVLVGAADDAEGGEVQHHVHLWLPGGGVRRGRLEGAEKAEGGGRDAEAVEDARRAGVLRVDQRRDVLEGGGVGGDGEAPGGGGSGDERGGWGGFGAGSARLHPRRPHGHGGCEDGGDGSGGVLSVLCLVAGLVRLGWVLWGAI